MPKTLITGGAGFIGGHLSARLLGEGHEIVLVDNLSRGVQDETLTALSERPGFSVKVADLRDPDSLGDIGSDFTHMFHFAALLGVQNVLDRPAAVLRENVSMLETMLDVAARQSALERFVFPSTSEVYVGTQQHFELPIPSPETTPLAVSPLEHPRTSYMLSKIYGEALVHQSGLPFTIVRPHNFYGPRMGLAHVVPQLLQRIHDAADGDELVVYSMDHRRTFCFIDDAVEYLVRLLGPGGAGGTFNIGVQTPEVTIGELAELLIAIVGRELKIVPGETTPGSPPRRCPDMTRTIGATGHAPAVSLEQGARRTYDWYRDRVFAGGGLSAR
ncbi:MAG: NAD-dependent epimerase/dehydratase family protein [Microthrixaceae bacterium]|nr:NAD-dependent epimerase/dehydratase family protein [Microthrixaceae bacterium]